MPTVRVKYFFKQARLSLRAARECQGELKEMLVADAMRWREIAKDTRKRGTVLSEKKN